MDFNQVPCCGARQFPRRQAPSSSADRGHSLRSLYPPPAALPSLPIGFGLALSANTAAMNRYAHLTDAEQQDILDKARGVRSEMEMYSLVASLAGGNMDII